LSASSLAAASLQDIGLVNATDLAEGFLAWARVGLPCRPGTTPPGAG
jgi:rhodanese-related sulfurtransferase